MRKDRYGNELKIGDRVVALFESEPTQATIIECTRSHGGYHLVWVRSDDGNCHWKYAEYVVKVNT